MGCFGELVCNKVPLAVLQDAFEYSYPPLPEDDFKPPLSELGQGEAEVKETEGPELRKVCVCVSLNVRFQKCATLRVVSGVC